MDFYETRKWCVLGCCAMDYQGVGHGSDRDGRY